MRATPFSQNLARLLKISGTTQLQVAQRTGFAHSSVNRWVSGHTNPTRDKVEILDKLFEARGDLLKTWLLTTTGSGLPEWARDMYALETRSVSLRIATPSLVPGYLQCPGYAEWLFRAGRPTLRGTELQRLVSHRVDRLSQLPDLRVTAVFPVTAVTDLPGELRSDQAQRLLEWLDTGRVSLHLVPRGTLLPAPVAPLMLFTTVDGDNVAASDFDGGFGTVPDTDTASARFNVALSESLPTRYSREELEQIT